MKTAERKLITPTDILLILIIILLAVFFIISFSGTSGKTAVITVDGAEVRRINLDSADNETLTLDTNPVVTLHISEGTIRFTNSQCPSKTWQHRGELKNPGDVAACVPAGTIVTVQGADSSEIDAIAG